MKLGCKGGFDSSPFGVSFQSLTLRCLTLGEARRKNRPFKIFNTWTSHEDFHDVVSNSWNQVFWGSKQFSLYKKLRNLKEVLKKFDDKHFAHISSRADFASKKLEIGTS